MKELNNTVEYKSDLTSSEVQCSVLFSDNTKKHCTSLVVSSDEDNKKKLKLFLKSFALKIIKQTYEENRKASDNLY